MSLKDNGMMPDSPGKHEMKDSGGSLVLINAVASGDSVASMRSGVSKQKEDTPVIKLFCDGRELKIDEELVHTGLSAISVKFDNTLECISSSRTLSSPSDIGRIGIMKHRNSFRNLHRPDLKRVPCLRKLSPTELESLFKGGSASQPQCHKTSQVQDRDQTEREANEVDESAYEVDRNDYYSVKAIKTCPNNICFEEECRSEMEGAMRTPLAPIPELRAPDIPPAMRLHVSRARVLTTVLASLNDESEAGDHGSDTAHNSSSNGVDIECECARNCADDYGELHVILPPRRDEDAFHAASEARQNRNIT